MKAGSWLETAIAKGLIRPEQLLPRSAPAPVAELPADLSEKAFQGRVVELAEWHGWRVYHTHDSRRSAAGWPDLALCREGALILAELKTDVGRVTAAQAEWLELLRTVPGLRVRAWRPSLWAAIRTELAEGGVA